MSEPKRYDCEDIGGWEGGGSMVVRDDGEYVAWEDYAALRAKMVGMVCGHCKGRGGADIGCFSERYLDPCPVCQPKEGT